MKRVLRGSKRALMDKLFPLQKILEDLCTGPDGTGKFPPCPGCGRKLKWGHTVRRIGGVPRASVWLWCSACPAAAVFDINPVPVWIQGGASQGPASGKPPTKS